MLSRLKKWLLYVLSAIAAGAAAVVAVLQSPFLQCGDAKEIIERLKAEENPHYLPFQYLVAEKCSITPVSDCVRLPDGSYCRYGKSGMHLPPGPGVGDPIIDFCDSSAGTPVPCVVGDGVTLDFDPKTFDYQSTLQAVKQMYSIDEDKTEYLDKFKDEGQ